jgi:hypothetical protein
MRFRSFALALAVLFTTAILAHHPDTTTIDAAAKKQPAVAFPHAKHVKVVKSCDTCHHTQKGLTAESKAKVEKCSTCHLDPKDPKIPGMREASLTKNPFHINCVSCHKEQKKGPTACTGCHKKK